jgi:uncharacterized repeat protein (TIGR02543 family)
VIGALLENCQKIKSRTSYVNIITKKVYNEETQSSTYKVEMNCDTKGAKIYYTTDGTTPSVASDKSTLYKGTFYTNDISNISAIAVHNKKYDSQIVSTSKGKIYKVTYELNGGTNCIMNPTVYQVKSTLKLSKPSKKGYKFSGWYTDKSFSKSTKVTKLSKGAKGKNGEIKLYAKWTPIKYTITFKSNGGTGKSYTKSCKYGVKYKINKNEFIRTGYKFIGWNTKKDGSGKSYEVGSIIKNLTSKNRKNITLYAQWEKI